MLGFKPSSKEKAINTDLTFGNSNKKQSIKEEILKKKLFEMNTGGVGTDTPIKSNINESIDPPPLFTFDQGFEILDEIDGEYLKSYLHLCDHVNDDEDGDRSFKLKYKHFTK